MKFPAVYVYVHIQVYMYWKHSTELRLYSEVSESGVESDCISHTKILLILLSSNICLFLSNVCLN
jgi:hypothetical protein